MATAFTDAAPLSFIHPADMPDVYALEGRGNCMMPLLEDGAILVMDKRQRPERGDTVSLVFTPEEARRQNLPGVVKRLAFALPPANCDGLIVVDQLNPPVRYVFASRDVLAVHKCIGIAEKGEDGRTRWQPSQEPPRATDDMLGGL